MLFFQMVSCALGVLHEDRGISYHRISSYIMSQFSIPPSPNHFAQVSRQLETMTKNGIVVFKNGLYKYASIYSPADVRAPLGLLNGYNPRVPTANLVDSSSSGAKFQYAGGNISNDVHVHMNNNVHMHVPTSASAPASNPIIGPGPVSNGVTMVTNFFY